MGLFKKIFVTASQMPAFQISLLFFIMFLAVIKSMALTFLDVSAVHFILTETSRRALGIDLIAVSIILGLVGYKTRLLYRRKGYGAIVLMTILILTLIAIIGLIEYPYSEVYNILFILKYAFFLLINAVFWSVCSRFFALIPSSLKFIFLLISEGLGYILGGGIIWFISIGAYGLLYYSVALLIVLYAGIYVLTQMKPVAKEIFIKPVGEAQDFTEQKMVRILLMFGFFLMTAFCIINYLFYTQTILTYQGKDILKCMAIWWGVFGLIECLLSFTLIRRRFFYLLSGNMTLTAVMMVLASLSVFYQNYQFIFISFLGISIILYMHYQGLVDILIKTLRVNGNHSINFKRVFLIEPTGFMLGGILIYHISSLFALSYVLLALGVISFCLLMILFYFYANVLLKSMRLREWRGCSLVFASQRVFDYIKKELPTVSPDEVIYFLRVLEISQHPIYMKTVLKSLKHSSEKVRFFALDRIRHDSNLTRYQSTVQFIFNTDASVSVRRQALAILIQIAIQKEDANLLDSYAPYLDNPSLRSGAMIGFLTAGGHHALLAMDGLQQMSSSNKTSDKLLALQVMKEAPSSGLIRLLMPLLKNRNTQIAQDAMKIAGLIKHAESLPFILSAIDDIELQENALVALNMFGIQSYPLIERTLHNAETSAFRQKVLILFLTMQDNIESKQVLLRALKIGNQKLRKAIIRGMIDTDVFWTHQSKYSLLKQGIEADFQRIDFFDKFLKKYKHSLLPQAQDAFAFLIRAITEDIEETRQLIFYQLLLLNRSKLFTKAVRILLEGNENIYPIALGVLQDLLRKDLYRIIEQVAYFSLENQKEVISSSVPIEKSVEDLCQLFLKPLFPLAPWIQANILNCLRKLGHPNGLKAVLVGLKSHNTLVLEASVEALCRLEEDQDNLNKILLTVPTSILVTLNLNSLLKK